MSTQRTRPTREQTTRRLFDAAAEVFVTKGIGAASVADICDAAGLTRGAFYSNFASKDELVLALLEFQAESNIRDTQAALDQAETPYDFFATMDPNVRQPSDPVSGKSVLFVELLLHAHRNPDYRERLVARQQASRANVKGLLQQIADDVGRDIPGGIDDAVDMLTALDMGMALQQMIEPDRHRVGQYGDFLATLHSLWAEPRHPS